MKLLVANRGEIAIRIMRGAAELQIATVAVAPEDDAGSLHTGKADEVVTLTGIGTAAYLDIAQLIAVAKETGCDAVHPGYGFLSENAELARSCEAAGLTFIGPRVETLELFGDKARARIAATAVDVPIIRGIDHAVSLEEAVVFFDELDAYLGPSRGSSGEPSSTDFVTMDLPTIVDEFAERFDALPPAFPERPDYRVLVSSGTLVAASVVIGQLLLDVDEDGAIRVAVEGNAEVGAGAPHRGPDVFEVRGVQRVRGMVGEATVRLEVQALHLEGQPLQEGLETHRRHAVPAVDGHLETRTFAPNAENVLHVARGDLEGSDLATARARRAE